MPIEVDHGPIYTDIRMVRGDDFIHTYRIGGRETIDDPTEYWDLTGWTLRGQVRRKEGRDDSPDVLASIAVTAAADQTTDTGVFTLEIQGSESGSPGGSKMFPTSCVGDVEFIDPDGRVRTYFRINFEVVPDVTRVAS